MFGWRWAVAASAPARLHVEIVERGLWCDRCMLPSLLRGEITALCEHGVSQLGHVTMCPAHLEGSVVTDLQGRVVPQGRVW